MGHRSRTLRRGSVGTLLVLVAAGTLLADGRPRVPTFAAGVDVVSLSVVVTDADGRQVAGLGPDDLTLLEDGVPQPITLFAQEEWPIRLVVLLDASSSMRAAMPVAKRAAIRLVRTLRAGDEGEVAQFDRSLRVVQGSTGDLEALERAIDSVSPGGETALYNVLYVLLKDEARRLDAHELRRRAVVVLSDGEDTSSMVTDEQLLALARRGGVVVYTIGLLSPPRAGLPAPTVPTWVLTSLARETGGRAYFPSSLVGLGEAYDHIAGDLRALYGVGYVPLNRSADGGFRRISIRARRPGLTVRHRSGYFAPRGTGPGTRPR
jgi:Ca-activated chloride channel family protein